MDRGKKYFLLAVLLVGVVIFAIAILRYSLVSPDYCRRCHVQKYEMWRTSFGHPYKEATCTDCHDVGNILSKKFTKDLEFINKRCIKCHEDMEKSKECKKIKIVKMNHQAHIKGKMEGKPLEMKCVDCHRNITHDLRAYHTNRPTMVSCFTGECHKKEKSKDKCNYCHYIKLVEKAK